MANPRLPRNPLITKSLQDMDELTEGSQRNSWTEKDHGQMEKEFADMLKKTQQLHLRESFKLCEITPETEFKNRYSDVLPIEKTRVKLKKTNENDSDYINANFVKSNDDHIKRMKQLYICCQAPLPSTIDDFWKMIWQERCAVIVMLVDKNYDAAAYWPESANETKYFGSGLQVKNKKTMQRNGIKITEIQITHKGYPSIEDLQLTHLLYDDWPDNGVPEKTEFIQSLIIEVDIRKRTLNEPILIHCSAGIGRTGTFLAIHINLQKVLETKDFSGVDIENTVLDLRSQRPGMVQNQDQYKMVYAKVKDIVKGKYNLLPSPKALPRTGTSEGTSLSYSVAHRQSLSESLANKVFGSHWKGALKELDNEEEEDDWSDEIDWPSDDDDETESSAETSNSI